MSMQWTEPFAIFEQKLNQWLAHAVNLPHGGEVLLGALILQLRAFRNGEGRGRMLLSAACSRLQEASHGTRPMC